MMRNAMLVVLILATGCEPDFRTCGPGFTGPLMKKPLFEGPFVHRIASIEVLEGDYVAPPVTGTETPAELRFEELSWVADVGAASAALAVLSHGELIEVEDPCSEFAYLTDVEIPWEERLWAHIAPEDIGRPIIAFDETLSDVEPASFDYGHSEGDGPLRLDEDRLGFVLAADYFVRPSGCTDTTCASTVRIRHHFRRTDAP